MPIRFAPTILLRMFVLVTVAFAVVALASGCRSPSTNAPYEYMPHGPGG